MVYGMITCRRGSRFYPWIRTVACDTAVCDRVIVIAPCVHFCVAVRTQNWFMKRAYACDFICDVRTGLRRAQIVYETAPCRLLGARTDQNTIMANNQL